MIQFIDSLIHQNAYRVLCGDRVKEARLPSVWLMTWWGAEWTGVGALGAARVRQHMPVARLFPETAPEKPEPGVCEGVADFSVN